MKGALFFILAFGAVASAQQDQPVRHHDMFAAISPDGARIAFMSDRTGDPEIYTANISGSDLRRLTFTPGRDAHPAWSPDGERIAFQSPRGSDSVRLFLMEADGTEQRLLVETRGFCGVPAWSPDGTQIAFQCSLRRVNPGRPDAPWRLFVVGSDGRNLRQVSQGPGNDQVPFWSPDGKKLLFFSDRAGNDQLYELELESGGVHPITAPPDAHRAAEYSSKGGHILLLKEREGVSEVYLLDRRSGEMTRLTEGASSFQSPRLSPDGRTILYQRSTADGERLYTMKVDGTNAQPLLLNPADAPKD